MTPPITELIHDAWYMAVPGSRIKPGKTLGKKLLNQMILIGRDHAGAVFALRDICPHRGIPLSHGTFDGREIECCYHGWRFDCAGTCTHIPSLLPTQKFEVDRVRVRKFPCQEVKGLIWVYVPHPDSEIPAELPPIPAAPGVGECVPNLIAPLTFDCNLDQAVIGLMDPAHGPFVHKNWFWRSGKTLKEKSKEYVPSHHGFTMVRHPPSSNSKVYRWFFGAEASTEIRFELPSTRIEHIQAGENHVVGMTTLTPLETGKVEFHQIFYWTLGWLNFAKPFLMPFVNRFVNQDRDVMGKQSEGLIEDPQLILINDADKPTRWYYQLKKEMLASRSEGREFKNPVPHTTLHWRT